MDTGSPNNEKTFKSFEQSPLEKTHRQAQSFEGVVSVSGSVASGSSRKSCIARQALREAELRERQVAKEVELELKLLNARNVTELARLRVDMANQEEEIDAPPHVPQVQRHTKVEKFLEDHNLRLGTHVEPTDEVPNMSTAAATLSNIAINLELPKLELVPFDGDPVQYWRFIRMFESYVESRVSDDRQRMLYLLHYCKGSAKESIEECVMLPPAVGYRQAREILRDLFGQPHQVARSLIDGLIAPSKNIAETPAALSQLAIRMRNCETALTQMGYVADLNAVTTLERVVKSLPVSMQHRWARVVDRLINDCFEPTFEHLREFISDEARVARSRFGQVARESECKVPKSHQPTGRGEPTKQLPTFARTGSFAVNHLAGSSASNRCFQCNGDHPIEACKRFNEFESSQRWAAVREWGGCFVCLHPSHIASKCQRKNICGVDGCKSKHHSLLHFPRHRISEEQKRSTLCGATRCTDKKVRLGILPVMIETNLGTFPTYAFVDSGSDTTLIRKDYLDKLGIVGQPSTLSVTTVTGSSTSNCACVKLTLRSPDRKEVVKVEKAYSIEDLPVRPVDSIKREAMRWPHLAGLPFNEIPGGEVSILLGSDVSELHWVFAQRLGGRRQPYAVKTLFGWMLCGPLSGHPVRSALMNCICLQEPSIMEQLRVMYDHEFKDIPGSETSPSQEDKVALALVRSASIGADGHFEVPIPWKLDCNLLPDNHSLALKRLFYLKRRFERDPELFQSYSNILQQHLDRGYIEKVPVPRQELSNRPKWYLPHHPVFNTKKPGKVRVVFDCAARCNGKSLNDALFCGPDLTVNLISVLLRFRSDRVAVAADIEEMFLQVRIPKADRGMFRFLWWGDKNLSNEPEEYQMVSHPFGAASSPFCASYALRRTVEEFGAAYDNFVRESVSKNFYVDDCLVALPSTDAAVTFVHDCSELLSKGGFRIRKWVSNDRQVLASILPSELAPSMVNIGSGPLPVQHTLGIQWDAETDEFRVSLDLPDKPPTRRGMLSCVSSLFDPLGLVSPWLLPGKRLLQHVCKHNLGWDEPVSVEDHQEWEAWLDGLRGLETVRVPRCILIPERVDPELSELHIFCDASEVGYGAVAYARFTSTTGLLHTALLCSKARVSPSKAVTIPRLELSAAVLATRLKGTLIDSLPQGFRHIFYWTDSMIVLFYIYNVSTRFATFVANRLCIIHEMSTPSQWRHVSSKENPADLTSRGTKGKRDIKRWLEGPSFLRLPVQDWPPKPERFVVSSEVEYKKPSAQVNLMGSNILLDAIHRYSDWISLLRGFAWLTRFKSFWLNVHGYRSLATLKVNRLTVQELRAAETDVIKLVQSQSFPVLTAVEKGCAERNDSLKKLCPMMIDGLLRVGGRLSLSNYEFDVKHPIILPKRHHVVDLIVRHYHESEGHRGIPYVLSLIRRRFWIIQGRAAVQRTIGTCMFCRRQNNTLGAQQMAPLPSVRVNPAWHPFTNVGVDYFGPLYVKRARSVEKRYGCLFTCLQSRAVHLEVAYNLSADSFIMALMRFVGRRGKPTDIYSDNGTNFVAADKELKRRVEELNSDSIANNLLCRGIQWHFNPPYSSHRGGVWERLIREVRKILNTVCTEQHLTDEGLITVLVETERILNNRPLVPSSSNDPDIMALSPSDLLILRSNTGLVPELDLTDRFTKGWRQANQMTATFWNRWRADYLCSLQGRQKWINKCRNFTEGDVVLVASEVFPRNQWPVGIVEKCEVDKDGLVRTLEIRTKLGTVRRDIRRVCLLEGVDPEPAIEETGIGCTSAKSSLVAGADLDHSC